MVETTLRVSGLRPARIEAFKRNGAPLRNLVISGIKGFFWGKLCPVTVQKIDGKIRFIFVDDVKREEGEKNCAQLREFIGKQSRLANNITISVGRNESSTHIEVSFEPARSKPVIDDSYPAFQPIADNEKEFLAFFGVGEEPSRSLEIEHRTLGDTPLFDPDVKSLHRSSTPNMGEDIVVRDISDTPLLIDPDVKSLPRLSTPNMGEDIVVRDVSDTPLLIDPDAEPLPRSSTPTTAEKDRKLFAELTERDPKTRALLEGCFGAPPASLGHDQTAPGVSSVSIPAEVDSLLNQFSGDPKGLLAELEKRFPDITTGDKEQSPDLIDPIYILQGLLGDERCPSEVKEFIECRLDNYHLQLSLSTKPEGVFH
jgi:hypothetical protein